MGISLKDTISYGLVCTISSKAVQRNESLHSERSYCSFCQPVAEVGRPVLSEIWDNRMRTDGTVITAVVYCLVVHSSSFNPNFPWVLSFVCLLSWCPAQHIIGLICRNAPIKEDSSSKTFDGQNHQTILKPNKMDISG